MITKITADFGIIRNAATRYRAESYSVVKNTARNTNFGNSSYPTREEAVSIAERMQAALDAAQARKATTPAAVTTPAPAATPAVASTARVSGGIGSMQGAPTHICHCDGESDTHGVCYQCGGYDRSGDAGRAMRNF